jgi:hypothetical protein
MMPPAAKAASIVVRKLLSAGPIGWPTAPADVLSRSVVVSTGVAAGLETSTLMKLERPLIIASTKRASLAVIERFSNDSTTALLAGS